MSVKVPDAPTLTPPVTVSPVQVGDHFVGRFSDNWLGWLLAMNRAVQDLQASIPISSQVFGPAPGPGPYRLFVDVTARRPAVLNVIGCAIQLFGATAPSWELIVQVDGVVQSTGIIANTWQTVIEMAFQFPVDAGLHTVQVAWASTTADATINSLSLLVFPAYTS